MRWDVGLLHQDCTNISKQLIVYINWGRLFQLNWARWCFIHQGTCSEGLLLQIRRKWWLIFIQLIIWLHLHLYSICFISHQYYSLWFKENLLEKINQQSFDTKIKFLNLLQYSSTFFTIFHFLSIVLQLKSFKKYREAFYRFWRDVAQN